MTITRRRFTQAAGGLLALLAVPFSGLAVPKLRRIRYTSLGPAILRDRPYAVVVRTTERLGDAEERVHVSYEVGHGTLAEVEERTFIWFDAVIEEDPIDPASGPEEVRGWLCPVIETYPLDDRTDLIVLDATGRIAVGENGYPDVDSLGPLWMKETGMLEVPA